MAPARLSTGDIIAVIDGSNGENAAVQGVLIRLEETKATVIVDDALDSGDQFALLKATSSVTHKRYKAALDELDKAATDANHAAHSVIQVVFGAMQPGFNDEVSLDDAQQAAIANLNEAQKDAVMLALRARDVAVLHGPPGTGKSTTVSSLVHVEVLRGSRVLVVAPSNVAADTLAERLVAVKPQLRLVRAGHPARVLPALEPFLLDNVVARSDDGALAQDVRAEIEATRKANARVRERARGRGRGRGRSNRAQNEELRLLRKELRKRDAEAVKRVLAQTQVVVCTVCGAGARALDVAAEVAPFDLVVVDEAGQATEGSVWVALLRGRRAVLAGDPFQLPPTVVCDEAERKGMSRSLLDRIFEQKKLHDKVVRMLTVQYRMNRVISDWSSNAMYGGRLVAAESVRDHLLSGLCGDATGAMEEPDLNSPFVVIDTVDGDCDEDAMDEDDSGDGLDTQTSRRNRSEVEIVEEVVGDMVRLGVEPKHIGVISPYAGQVELLRERLRGEHGRALEIATVDSFQGREKEMIVISLVRANDAGDVGFLKDSRRINVAVTRARRAVVVVCDSATVSNDKFVKGLLEYAEEHGETRSAIAEFSHIVGEGGNVRKPPEAVKADVEAKKKGKKKKSGARKGKVGKNPFEKSGSK